MIKCSFALFPRRPALAAIFAMVLLFGSAGCQPGGPTQGDATTNATKSPAEMLREMVDAYQNANSYQDAGELHIVPESGQETEPQPFAVAWERPNKIRIHSLGAMIVADGAKFRAATPSLPEQVLVRPIAGDFSMDDFSQDELLLQAMRGQLEAALPQLTLLVDPRALATLTDGSTLEQLSDADVQGETCHRVAARGTQGTAVFWISADSHLLRKYEFPTRAIREKFPLAAVWADFRGARTGAAISPQAFQMELPPTARMVKRFILPGPDAPPALLSQRVADFAFILPRGEKVSRESLAGKVVVIDLWATWCGWCFEGLPLVEQVYQKYKDDPRVVFLAVCKDETAVSDEKVRATFIEHKLTIPIVRDLQQVSDQVFQVQALPTSVLLGADGSVQDYHVGFDAQLAHTLPKKIDSLLAGENLAQQEIDAYQQERAEFEKRLSEVLVDAPQADEAAEIARQGGSAK